VAEVAMQVIEVTDPSDARRAKYSQYAGSPRAISLNGQMVSGIVRSVAEVQSASPVRWVVTVLPMPIRQMRTPEAKVARRR
jgi:hypothetical protein